MAMLQMKSRTIIIATNVFCISYNVQARVDKSWQINVTFPGKTGTGVRQVWSYSMDGILAWQIVSEVLRGDPRVWCRVHHCQLIHEGCHASSSSHNVPKIDITAKAAT